MPIDYSKYPPNWSSEIRPRILKRANNCCEWCKAPNKTDVWRDLNGNWHLAEDFIDAHSNYSREIMDRDFPGWETHEPFKFVKIILTIAHLDHDENNHDVKDDRLAALCQRCHLQYDAPEKARRRKVKKYKGTLLPL
jgi:5-methylcytosine-specific restriction endonuclease McrA